MSRKLDKAADEGEELTKLKDELREILARRPQKNSTKKIIVDDITPTALGNLLQQGSKNIFMVSTEAGGLWNGSLGRQPQFLNAAWDSTPILRGRADQDIAVNDYRLSCHLALQEPVLTHVFARTGNIAHGSGLTARMLFTQPHSTLGHRTLDYRQVNATDRVTRMGDRVRECLQEAAERRRLGKARRTISFSKDSADLFDQIYNQIQSHLGEGMGLNGVAGHAAKIAEQIARIAGMFHAFEWREGPLSCDTLARARNIGHWHMGQFLRKFGPGHPGDQVVIDARVVANALEIASYREPWVSRTDIKLYCTEVMSQKRVDRAVQLLIKDGYVKLYHGRVGINPYYFAR